MAYANVPEADFKIKFVCPYFPNPGFPQYLTLQYDSATPTSVNIKFQYNKTGTKGPEDMFYVLSNPEDATKRKLHTLKGWHGQDASKWPCVAPEVLTIYKDYNADGFALPELWICNDGNNNTADDATSFYNNYKNGAYRGDELKCVVSARTLRITGGTPVAKAVQGTAPRITDLFSAQVTGNSPHCGACSITASAGTVPTNSNNSVKSTTLQYKIGSGSWTTYADGLSISSLKLTSTGTSNTQAVKAKVIVEGTYGPNAEVESDTVNVRRYVAPQASGEPTLHKDSLKNNRLILKQNWKWTWAAAAPGTGTASDSSSIVTGYRIQLLRCRPPATTYTSIAFKSADGTYVSNSSNLIDYSASTTFIMNPLDCDLLPGDKVKLSVKAFTQTGRNNDGTTKLVGPETKTSDRNAGTVQNAGVLRYKPTDSGEWKEAVVWYKKSNTEWVEAEVVKYKPTDSGEWKEST